MHPGLGGIASGRSARRTIELEQVPVRAVTFFAFHAVRHTAPAGCQNTVRFRPLRLA